MQPSEVESGLPDIDVPTVT